jgi:hypothetical protein
LLVLGLLGSTFGQFGCPYALNKDYQTLLQAIGDAAIKTVSDNVFGSIGKDFDAIIRTPTTAFAQSVWNNYMDAYVPNDIELK